MKLVLLNLSGPPERAREILETRFPHADIDVLARGQIESYSMLSRVTAVRRLRPDIFAVATERLVWQRGQDALLLLGALSGASRTIVFDAHEGWREEAKGRAIARAPLRVAREAALSSAAMRRAAKDLRALETAVNRDEHREFSPTQRGTNPQIVYLRASPGPGTQAGGAASHINGFVNAALQLGVQVSVISNDEIAGLDQRRVPMKIIWPKPIGSTRAAFDIYNNLHFAERAVSEIQNEPPDFIYQRYARFSWSGVVASIRTKRPLFLEYNGSEVWVGEHWDRVDRLDLLARYERLNLRAASKIFVVSEVERQQLLSDGFEEARIVVNPNGADVERFKPNVGGQHIRQDLAIAPDEILVGFLGTFGPWHGVEVLAQAILRLPRDNRLRFLFVGGGASRPQIEEILTEQVAKRRVMFAGTVSHEQVPALLDACDILVSPHVPLAGGRDFFGSPTKLYEYMAMGKGIVASRLGQIGESLIDEKTALLVEPGNVAELAAAITRLAESPTLREHLGLAARDAAIARHTWVHNAKRVMDAYQSWVNGSNQDPQT